VSTASVGRSFSSCSTLKHLKDVDTNKVPTYKTPSLVKSDTGLALLNIYRDIIVDPLQIVNKLTQHRQQLNLLV